MLHAAVVGSGPSGMYTAKYLLSALNGGPSSAAPPSSEESTSLPTVRVDVLERLPTPFGLVRSGVAPDHPEVKNVERDFERLFEGEGNATPAGGDDNEDGGSRAPLAYRGNVSVGEDVSLRELRDLYDVVVLAYGCENDKKLGIVGEDLRGVLSAREFVAWYNGHPDFVHVGEAVSEALRGGGKGDGNLSDVNVVVIGQGNVALDCARVLAKGGTGLGNTDVASHALPILGDGVGCVTVLGRRGHVQGAFTIKELRELTKLEKEGHGARFVVRGEDLDAGTTDASREELEGPGARPRVRIDKLLRDQSKAAAASSSDAASEKEVRLRFLLRPSEFRPRPDDPSRLGSVLCERTRLEGEAGSQRAAGTGETEEFPADLALVSIGYKGTPLPGMELENDNETLADAESSRGVFDAGRGVVRNAHGTVVRMSSAPSSSTSEDDASPVKGLYVSGWLKRGPSGIIGTNIPDAKDTVASILRDVRSGSVAPALEDEGQMRGREGLDKLLRSRGVESVDWEGYRRLDAAERRAAERSDRPNRPREKITSVEEMMNIVRSFE